jgi:hypothetical protein
MDHFSEESSSTNTLETLISKAIEIAPTICHYIVIELHRDLLEYITWSFKMDNTWGYNYFVTGDVWYWYNINHANRTYKSLSFPVQKCVDIPALFRCPDSQTDIFKKASQSVNC